MRVVSLKCPWNQKQSLSKNPEITSDVEEAFWTWRGPPHHIVRFEFFGQKWKVGSVYRPDKTHLDGLTY
jgi:hypothetical protein